MSTPLPGEQGYVLISAIWMLALAGSIVAYLMLGSVEASRQTRSAGELLKARLAFDAVLETIVADRIINGDRSKWSRAPMTGTIMIDGMAVRVRSTDESARVDINRADMQTLDLVLGQAGLREREKQVVLARIALARGQKRPVRAMAEMAAILGVADGAVVGRCLLDIFTATAGGQSISPSLEHLSNANALLATLRAGTIQRLELRSPKGMARTILIRVIGQQAEAMTVMDWSEGQMCERGLQQMVR